MGIMDKWIRNMLGDWDHCRQENNKVTLSFEDTYAILVMWALLIATSLLAFGCEKAHYACNRGSKRVLVPLPPLIPFGHPRTQVWRRNRKGMEK